MMIGDDIYSLSQVVGEHTSCRDRGSSLTAVTSLRLATLARARGGSKINSTTHGTSFGTFGTSGSLSGVTWSCLHLPKNPSVG